MSSVGKLIVYISDDCDESEQVIHLLDELEVSYEKKNIDEDRAHLKELQARQVYSAPAIFFNDKSILGFQRESIIRLIRKNNLGNLGKLF